MSLSETVPWYAGSMRMVLVLPVLLVLTVPLGARAVLTNLEFEPPEFYVGDRVVLRAEYLLDSPMTIRPPGFLPESDWIDIRNPEFSQDGLSVHVSLGFTPFAPGTRTLPTVFFGDLVLQDIKIPVFSVGQIVQGQNRDLKGQLLVPGARLLLVVLFALLAMAPFIGVFLVRFVRNRTETLLGIWKKKQPWRRLKRTLRILRQDAEDDEASDWYGKLTEALRVYLSKRVNHDCVVATTAEISHMPEFHQKDTPASQILDILKIGDMVKFAGRGADEHELNTTLDTVEQIVSDWERHRVPV